eukprot:1159716-Pelagomonas_calceolata.AAC.2
MSAHLSLVPKERVHVRPVIQAPQLHSPVQGAAEQLVAALPEGQARHGIPARGTVCSSCQEEGSERL